MVVGARIGVVRRWWLAGVKMSELAVKVKSGSHKVKIIYSISTFISREACSEVLVALSWLTKLPAFVSPRS
ncbi:hypothetical protein V6N13_001014 [Hibiscus sabdariffa]